MWRAGKPHILVTGAGGPAGINVIELLRGDYYVVSTDTNPYSEGFALSARYYVVPPASEGKRFVEFLDDLVERESVDLVIPTVDEEIEALVGFSSRYADKIVVHPRETVEICLNKLRTYEYLEKRIPEIIPEFSPDPRSMRAEVVVKKPVKGRGGRGIGIGDRRSFSREEGFFFVEHLPGREWTVDAVADRDGNIMVAVPRVRLKTRAGVSVVGRVIVDKRIIGYVEDLAEHIKFAGGFNVQFKEDAKGDPKLQEINVRFSGGLDITAAAGANLPRILVEYWLLGKKPGEVRIREGVYVKIPEVYVLE